MPKISVIIPCYNAEQYISNLNQLWEQTTSDFELILVDDCSSDNTWNLLNNFKEANPGRAIIVARNKRNIGPGGTRNHGLQLSSGQYVIFLDCDDGYAPDLLEQMAKQLDNTGADFVCCEFTMVNPDKSTDFLFDSEQISQVQIYNRLGGLCSGKINRYTIKTILFQPSLYPNPYNKMVRYDFLASHNILFPDLWYGEDRCWNIQLILKAKHIAIINRLLYRYIKRPNSLSTTYSEKSIKGLFTQLNQELEILKEANLLPQLDIYWHLYYWDVIFDLHRRLSSAPESQRQQLLKKIRNDCYDFCHTHNIPFEPNELTIFGILPCYKLIPKIKIWKNQRTSLKAYYQLGYFLRQYQVLTNSL